MSRFFRNGILQERRTVSLLLQGAIIMKIAGAEILAGTNLSEAEMYAMAKAFIRKDGN